MKFRRRKPPVVDATPGAEIEVKRGPLGHPLRYVVWGVTLDGERIALELLTPEAARWRLKGDA